MTRSAASPWRELALAAAWDCPLFNVQQGGWSLLGQTMVRLEAGFEVTVGRLFEAGRQSCD